MKKFIEIKTIAEYNEGAGFKTEHPLVGLVDFSQMKPTAHYDDAHSTSYGFYAVFLKFGKQCDIKYGRNYYDYQDGTLVFVAPGQVLSIEARDPNYVPGGHGLLFHPDFIRGTSLAQHMKDYSFFSYDVHEALHLSETERQVIMECFNKIQLELKHAIDKHSKKLIVSNIELFLNYCVRYYERQFVTRDTINLGILEKFQVHLNEYFQSEKPQNAGLPSVAHFADQFHLSPNYFGDLIKKESGKTAQEYIQLAIIHAAKEKIFDVNKSISEVAYELGFKYPQHFTRFFKQHLGYTPNEFRNMN